MLIAFDCEATGLEAHDTLTCIVAIKVNDGLKTVCTYSAGAGQPLDVASACAFIDELWKAYTEHQATIVSFNGIGFDFRKLHTLLHNKPVYTEKIELLALASCDIMLDFATEHGYFASMQSFAQGCGLDGKTQTGAWAAENWKKHPEAVLAYCQADVEVLLELWQYRCDQKRLFRCTKAGKRVLWVPQAATFRPAHVCITTFQKEPVVPSWMSEPPKIDALWNWLL